MEISKNLLKTIAASVIIGGAMASCEKAEISIASEVACELDCEIDHNHNKHAKSINSHVADCPACGMG